MSGSRWRAALLVLAALGCTLERRAPVVPADLVLRHGEVYTMSPARPWADAVAVRDGRIVYLGEDPGVDKFIGMSTDVIDLGGRLVLPGFQDSHAHPLSGGLELGECNLYTARTPAEVEGAIRAYVSQRADLKWIRGNGWQLPVFPGANPKRELLDRLVPDRPAFFYSADGHSAWVNSKALELAGITAKTRDPAGGRIERDAAGNPSGTLRESAMDLVSRLLPEYSTQDRIGAARRALAEANRFGITTITDADAGPEYLEAYRALDDQNQLTARVYTAIHVEKNPVEGETSRLVALRRRYSGSRLHADQVKFYADGVIEARTAALLAPYAGHGAETGSLNYTPEELATRISALDRQGFQIHIHAIGDRAIRVSLDALAQARKDNGHRDARPIIAHIELFDPADLPRFREIGVIASFQPYWAQADEYIRDLTLPILGPARSRWLYPIETMLNSGAVVVGGSDWTVSSLNPLDAIQVAITRRSVEEPNGPAWLPEERADLPRMLAAYTINAAYANRAERETGSLELGKLGDLIVLDRNLFAIPPTEIHRAKVLLTLVEGREVYRDTSFARP
ncbi:MAG TPA: amidohydrolase [Gemmatimonadales bacterium]|nr:amidohydrolase [Gemmatimonadales bacterium]